MPIEECLSSAYGLGQKLCLGCRGMTWRRQEREEDNPLEGPDEQRKSYFLWRGGLGGGLCGCLGPELPP